LQGAATGRIQWHVILEPRITLQGAASWRIHCHDSRATCHIAGCYNSIRHIENRFSPCFIFLFFNAVWALTSGGFRIVFDTLVSYTLALDLLLRKLNYVLFGIFTGVDSSWPSQRSQHAMKPDIG